MRGPDTSRLRWIAGCIADAHADAEPSLDAPMGTDALDAVTGGVDSGVTYIVFTGASGVVTRNEDSAEAMRIGATRAAQLVSGI